MKFLTKFNIQILCTGTCLTFHDSPKSCSITSITSVVNVIIASPEKKILNLSKIIKTKEKDLNESQLDFTYLSSPLIIHDKIKLIDNEKYVTMEYSKIFLSMSSFLDLQNRLAIQRNQNETQKK